MRQFQRGFASSGLSKQSLSVTMQSRYSAGVLSTLPASHTHARTHCRTASMRGLHRMKLNLKKGAFSRPTDTGPPTCTMFGRKATLSSERAEQFLLRALDFAERMFILVPFAAFAVALSYSLALRPYNLLALVYDSLLVFFILFRRDAKIITGRPLDWVLAFAGTVFPLFLRPGGQIFIPTIVGAVLMFAGLLICIWALFSLRRSFGLAAANRGLIQSGPYRLMRHPMYAGYMLVNVGFLMNNPTFWNLAVVTVSAGLQIARIFAEDEVLAQDPDHAAFSRRVRYRLVPGLF